MTRRIVSERKRGRTFQAIADGLMIDCILTSREGQNKWYPATIKAVVESDNAAVVCRQSP